MQRRKLASSIRFWRSEAFIDEKNRYKRIFSSKKYGAPLDERKNIWYNNRNIETVDSEITVQKSPQRVPKAEKEWKTVHQMDRGGCSQRRNPSILQRENLRQ